MKSRLFSALAALVVVSLSSAMTTHAAPCSSAYVTGDVFASVGNSTVDVFTPTGSLVCTLNDASGATFTTGLTFDSAGNLYVTNFSAGTVSQFNNSGTLLASSWATAGNNPESIVAVSTGPNAGTFFVGGSSGAAHNIEQFSAGGTLLNTFTVAGGNGTGGTDWIDFQNDSTILYDGEGNIIKSFNIATSTQNPDFATSTATSNFALRVIPGGTFGGDVLVADSSQAELFSSAGVLLKTYTLPGNGGGDFALNLDPNGADFWTSDFNTGTVWEVDIATGTIVEQWTTGSSSTFGLAVFGELTTTGTTVPEPGTLSLLACGLVGLASRLRKRGTA